MLDAEFLDWLSVTVADALAEPYVPKEEKEERRAMGYPPPPLQPFGGGIQLIFCGDFLQLPPVQKSADDGPRLRDAPETRGRRAVRPSRVRGAAGLPERVLARGEPRGRRAHDDPSAARPGLHGSTRSARARARRDISQLLGFTRRALPPRTASSRHGSSRPTGSATWSTTAGCALPSPLTTTTSFDSVVAGQSLKAARARRGREGGGARRGRGEPTHDEFFADERAAPRAARAAAHGGRAGDAAAQRLPGGFVNGDTGVVGFEAVEPNTEEHKQLSKDLPEALGVAWPRVCFARSTRSGREEKLLPPVKFERRIFRRGKCIRWQCPLRLSWAITIHKSQGMSLPYVVCDIGGAFAPGQVYVALSRAVSMQGMQIVNFDEQRIKVSYPALYFHRACSEASRTRDAAPLARFWSQSHFWWLPLVNTPNAHPRWLELYEARVEASQLQRWRATYPVPQNLCSPSMQAAAAAERASKGAS